MNCPKCNQPLVDGAKFCLNCGAPVQQPEMQPQNPQQVQQSSVQQPQYPQQPVWQPPVPQKSGAPKWVLPVVIGILAAIILALVLVLVLRRNNPADLSVQTSGYMDENPQLNGDYTVGNVPVISEPNENVQPDVQQSPTVPSSLPSNLFVSPNKNASNEEKYAWFKNAVGQAIDLGKMKEDIDEKHIRYTLKSGVNTSRPDALGETFFVDGVIFRFGMSYDEIVSMGWQLKRSTIGDNVKTKPGYSDIITFEQNGKELAFWMTNISNAESDDLKDFVVSGIYPADANVQIIFLDSAGQVMGNLDYSATAEQVLGLLGEPDSISYYPDKYTDHLYINYYLEDVDIKLTFDPSTGAMTDMETKY